MEDEIIEIYEYNDQTLELSLVTEEEIPEALEVVRDTFERTKNKKCKVFRLESDEKMRSYMTDKGFAVKAMRYGEMVAVFVVQTEEKCCIDLFLVSYDLYKKWGGGTGTID